MKARLLNDGGYDNAVNVQFPVEVEVERVDPRHHEDFSDPYGLVYVSKEELERVGFLPDGTTSSLAFVYDCVDADYNEAELIEE